MASLLKKFCPAFRNIFFVSLFESVEGQTDYNKKGYFASIGARYDLAVFKRCITSSNQEI